MTVFHKGMVFHKAMVFRKAMVFHKAMVFRKGITSLCYVQHTVVSSDGCSIHHYAMMVLLSIIMLYTQLYLSIIMLCSIHKCIM